MAPTRGGARVLVIARDPDLRAYLVRCLDPLRGRLGQVETAGNLDAATLGQRGADVVVVDGDPSLQAIHALATRPGPSGPTVGVLILAAPATPSDLSSTALSVCGPIDSRSLCRAVDEVLTRIGFPGPSPPAAE